GLERHVGLLRDRESIHVRAEGNRRPGFRASKQGRDARVSDSRAHLEAERTKVFGHDAGRARLAIAELRVSMEIAPPLDHFRLNRSRCRVELRAQSLC